MTADLTHQRGYDPYCLLPRPHGPHWNGLGRGVAFERRCDGEPAAAETEISNERNNP